jgi:phosphoribosyl-AMP cyclohydrolase
MTTEFDVSQVRFNSDGLVPVITQEDKSGLVLMLAWMNLEALTKTLELREAVYFSRSRNELWHKGSTSGNYQTLTYADADVWRQETGNVDSGANCSLSGHIAGISFSVTEPWTACDDKWNKELVGYILDHAKLKS